MARYLIVNILNGFLFGVMDATVKVTLLVGSLYGIYLPIARIAISGMTGIAINRTGGTPPERLYR